MDAATKLKITGALFTLVLPVGTAAAVTLAGRKLKPQAAGRPWLAPLALLSAFTVAWLGINGWPGLPPASVDGYVLWGALATGLGVLAADRGPAALRPALTGVVITAGLALFLWRLLAPLALWGDGAVAPLARDAWALDAGLAALVV
ncbi:MAG: hypothetical protein KC613_27880, partial [Myxococcales bacterium]|nr:hypothetical protein [Myxococcales bacterium]